jgi:hypothetical protein
MHEDVAGVLGRRPSARALAPARLRFRHLVELTLFGLLPAAVMYAGLRSNFDRVEQDGFVDFHPIWLIAGRIVHHQALYSPSVTTAPAWGVDYVYPLPTALAAAPLGLLSVVAAVAVFAVISIGAVIASLWVLGVRDWRCYGAAFVLKSTETAVTTGTLSSLMLLAFALTWRYRNSGWRAGSAVAAGTLMKVFSWPLAIWLVGTRRYLQAGAAAVVAVGSCAVTAMILGWHALTVYPSVAKALAKLYGPESYSLPAGLHATGIGWSGATGACLLAAVGITGAALVGERRGRLRESEAFALVVFAALVATPILWLHYLVLLLVPAALASRRLSAVWLVQGALWVGVPAVSGGSLPRIALVWISVAITTVAAVRPIQPRFLIRLASADAAHAA